MKDHVFSGADVAEAVALAAANLGLPLAELRYVVLEAGSAGRPRALAHARPDRRAAATSGPAPAPAPPSRPRRRRRPAAQPPTRRAGIRETIRAVAEAGGLAVHAEIEEGPRRRSWCACVGRRPRVLPRARRPGRGAAGDRAPAAAALRRRSSSRAPCGSPARASASARDQTLAAEARRVAAEVRADGRARRRCRGSTPTSGASCTWRSQEEPGIRTSSAGEGAERRLTVAPAASGAGEPARRVSTARPLEALGALGPGARRGSRPISTPLAAWSPRVNLTGARTAARARAAAGGGRAAGGGSCRRAAG